MISWWWLLVEGAALLLLSGRARGITRAVALNDALIDPEAARAELGRRWKIKPEYRHLIGRIGKAE